MKATRLFAMLLAACSLVFTSCDKDGKEEKPEEKVVPEGAVDLGLSVMWASCNLGAQSPEQKGSFYAWGEVEPKTVFTEENCLTSGKTVEELKAEGIVDANGDLNASHDAARVALGGKWRIPTDEEYSELSASCKWTFGESKGVKGYTVTGPNGNSIFLPIALNQAELGPYGLYWISSAVSGYSSYFGFYECDASKPNFTFHAVGFRHDPACIRSVTE